jgi:hypothetical protein
MRGAIEGFCSRRDRIERMAWLGSTGASVALASSNRRRRCRLLPQRAQARARVLRVKDAAPHREASASCDRST